MNSRQKLDAGDHSTNIQTAEFHIHQGMSPQQLAEVVTYIHEKIMEVFESKFIKFTDEAYQIGVARAHWLLMKFITRLAEKAPENLESVKTVAMQDAIYKAQTTAAVVGDDDLSDTLVDILIDKSGTEARSFKGVVLTQALDVAAKLTADQINLLTALLMITQTIQHALRTATAEQAIEYLEGLCRPLYVKIPTNVSAVDYMAYTGVGAIQSVAVKSAADHIIRQYDAIFTNGFALGEVSESVATIPIPNLIVPLKGEGDAQRYRVGIASSKALDGLPPNDNVLLPHKKAITSLIKNRYIPTSEFNELVSAAKPEFAKLLSDFDRIRAGTFMLSTVGKALGQANWRCIQPQTAPNVDIYLQ